MAISKNIALAVLLAVAEARFGQEQVPVAAVQALGNAGFGGPGVAATIAGSIPGSLLAAAGPCQKLTIADQIITELGDDQQVVDAAIGLVSAETNFNPFVVDVPFVCADPALPASVQLRGITPLVDPAVAGSADANAVSEASVAAPFDAEGLSQAEVLLAQGFSSFTAVNAAGENIVLDGQDAAAGGDAAGDDAAGDDAAGDDAAGDDAAGDDAAEDDAMGDDAAGDDAAGDDSAGDDAAEDDAMGDDAAEDDAAEDDVAQHPVVECGVIPTNGTGNAGHGNGNVNQDDNAAEEDDNAEDDAADDNAEDDNAEDDNAEDDNAADDNAQDDNNAEQDQGGDVNSGNLDFGLCQPTMARVGGLNGRPADEFTFIPQDPLTAEGQQEALNPNIITNRICDQLINVCEADAAAIAACEAAQAEIEALGTRDQSTADTWNALLGFAGADSSVATI